MIRILSTLLVASGILLPTAALSITFTEGPDAGPLIPSAAEPVDPIDPDLRVPLTAIDGTISNTVTDVPTVDLSAQGAEDADVDLYQIFISDPAGFSATTTGGDSVDPEVEFDAVLALFDENGFGIYSNDDAVSGNGNASLPAGDPLSPLTQGIYFLAIFDDDVSPISSLDLNGPIFPDILAPFTAVVGPTGPGGGAALIEWFPDATIDATRAYTISLTGVMTVPEPMAMVQSLAALTTVVVVVSARRRKHSGPKDS